MIESEAEHDGKSQHSNVPVFPMVFGYGTDQSPPLFPLFRDPVGLTKRNEDVETSTLIPPRKVRNSCLCCLDTWTSGIFLTFKTGILLGFLRHLFKAPFAIVELSPKNLVKLG